MSKEPIDRRIPVGSYRLRLLALPGDGPTVVLESGGGLDSTQWEKLAPELARVTGSAVVRYDRAGFGESELPAEPHDVSREVRDLRTALERLGLPRPFVLVGHSYGGFLIQLFAHQDPGAVGGLVFVDPNVASFVDGLGGPEALMAHPLLRLPYSRETADLDRSKRAMLRMADGFPSTVDVLRRSPLPTTVPTIVISAGVPWWPKDTENEQFRAAHHVLADSVADGELVIAERSGHMVHRDQPEIIIQAVRQLVDVCRGDNREAG